MPINNGGGRRGSGGILAIPGKRFGASLATGTVLSYSGFAFRSQPFSTYNSARITGVTKDSTGAALGTCVVKLFLTTSDTLIDQTISDGSGNYSFTPTQSGPFYVVSYKAGSPDVAGTTVNTLTGA